ncbi:unnamed protein product [Lampetra fluviatilis]
MHEGVSAPQRACRTFLTAASNATPSPTQKLISPVLTLFLQPRIWNVPALLVCQRRVAQAEPAGLGSPRQRNWRRSLSDAPGTLPALTGAGLTAGGRASRFLSLPVLAN